MCKVPRRGMGPFWHPEYQVIVLYYDGGWALHETCRSKRAAYKSAREVVKEIQIDSACPYGEVAIIRYETPTLVAEMKP